MTEESNASKRGRGRPPIAPGERTTPLPAIKVGMTTRKKIEFYAASAGLSVSEYVRRAIEARLSQEGGAL